MIDFLDLAVRLWGLMIETLLPILLVLISVIYLYMIGDALGHSVPEFFIKRMGKFKKL